MRRDEKRREEKRRRAELETKLVAFCVVDPISSVLLMFVFVVWLLVS
jgi:nitrate reductase NapE component